MEFGRVDPDRYIQAASDEIDAKLGFKYKVPIVAITGPPWGGTLAPHEALILKSICLRLATGRMICSVWAAEEDQSQHAYGRSLIRDALSDLMAIANGEVDLKSAQLNPQSNSGFEDKTPSGYNHDAESMVDAWENHVMRGQPYYARPGAAQTPLVP